MSSEIFAICEWTMPGQSEQIWEHRCDTSPEQAALGAMTRQEVLGVEWHRKHGVWPESVHALPEVGKDGR